MFAGKNFSYQKFLEKKEQRSKVAKRKKILQMKAAVHEKSETMILTIVALTVDVS